MKSGLSPLVSIIVPVYNSSKYLHECLDSIVNQTFKDIEVICVNDGSTDNSLDILNEYALKDERLRVISKDNSGSGSVATARNMGFDYSNGKYVQWLDSDDFFELDMIRTLVEKAEQTNADIVVCGAKCYDDTKKQFNNSFASISQGVALAPCNQPFSYKDCIEYIFQIGNLYIWNKLFKKKLIESNNLRFERLPLCEDLYVVNMAIITAERIATVDKDLYYYRINTGSNLSDKITLHPNATFIACLPVLNALNKLNIYESVRKSFINLVLPSIRYFYDGMKTFEAFEYLHNTLRNEVFKQLDIVDVPESFFYDRRTYCWLRMIIENEATDVAFNAAYAWSRKYGQIAATTFVLREDTKSKG